METQDERKAKIVELTIQNILQHAQDGPVRLSSFAVHADQYLEAAVAALEGSYQGASVQRLEDAVIIERPTVQ